MNETLDELASDFWEWTLQTSPTWALMLGDHRFDRSFEDATRIGEDERIRALREFGRRAAAIDDDELHNQERVTKELLVFETETSADALEMRHAEFAVNHAVGMQSRLPTMIGLFPIQEPEHAEAMLDKFAAMATHIVDAADRLRDGVARGRTPHAFTVQATIAQLDAYLASPIEDDPYCRVRVPAAFDAHDAEVWKRAIDRVVMERVRPAWTTFRDVVAGEVAPAALPDDTPGVCFMPDGDELYRRAIRRHTSVGLEAEEIHDIGLGHVAALEREYRELGAVVFGTDDLQTIYATLRDDPGLRFVDGQGIVRASEIALANAASAMGQWFDTVPKAACAVDAVTAGPLAFYMPPASDGSRPGTFFVNAAEPTRWQTFFVEAMAFHEGIPGHHLQLAIADELEQVPEFRKHASVTAFAEGWGLYSERLADEMGLYSSPMNRFGMLVADSMRAARLVVDTGLHALRWSREQAIEFMASNSPMHRGMVEAEIDRYIGTPGQALSYMVGRLEIDRYRRTAEETMGERFDIRSFHDVVLGSGMVPLPTLERSVREWAGA